jgi:hypothetical protein
MEAASGSNYKAKATMEFLNVGRGGGIITPAENKLRIFLAQK